LNALQVGVFFASTVDQAAEHFDIAGKFYLLLFSLFFLPIKKVKVPNPL
jgi:hypothetical protein